MPDTSTGTAELNFHFLTEQGSIHLDGSDFEVRKHGWATGHWTLESKLQTLIDGQQTSAYACRMFPAEWRRNSSDSAGR